MAKGKHRKTAKGILMQVIPVAGLHSWVQTSELLRIERQSNGTWTAFVRIDLRAHLRDGRSMETRQVVRVPGIRQKGRKRYGRDY